MSTSRTATVLTLLLASACAPTPLPPEALFQASTHCAARACEVEETECRVAHARRVQECWNVCAEVGGCDVCLRNSEAHCNQCRYSNACADRVNTFVVPNAVVLPLYESCQAYVEARTACGGTVDEASCTHHAGVERIEATAIYDCWRDAGCDSEARALCGDPAPVHGLPERVCGGLTERGGLYDHCFRFCDPGTRDWLILHDWWLRDDVLDGLAMCEQLSVCGEYADCVHDWMRAVDGG